MADRVLLVAKGDEETVSAFNHVYAVESGYVVVDVAPYREGEPLADAARDAEEICRLVRWEEYAGQRQPVRLFNLASQDEVDAWRKSSGGSSDASKPAGKAAPKTPGTAETSSK